MKTWTRKSAAHSPPHRGGAVILIVLVVIVVLSLGAYTFAELMLVEAETAELHGRQAQAHAMADSGLDYVAALLDDKSSTNPVGTYNDPALFRNIVVRPGDTSRDQGRFSVIAPWEADDTRQSVRFGTVDESGKLNLNALSRFGKNTGKQMLMAIPGMTDEIADSILDWTDQDDMPRDYGAETDYYLALATPYSAKNGPLESLDELLLVRGMTPQLLYGEDANRNGLLDPGENDGDVSHPSDDANGVLDLGFSAFMTVNSREANLRDDGTPRINIASDKLDELYDTLEQEFDTETATFVIAYRLYGPAQTSSPQRGGGSSGSGGRTASKGNSPGVGTGSNAGAGTGQTLDSGDGVNTGEVGGETADSSASTGSSGGSPGQGGTGGNARQGAVQIGKNIFGGQGQVTRGGMELSGGSKFPVQSIFDLIGVSVKATIEKREQTLESPWSDDPSEMRRYLSALDDAVTTFEEDNLAGRINVNEASYEVLRGLPEMTDELAWEITTRRLNGMDGESLTSNGRDTIGWLVTEDVTDLPTLRKIAPFLTAGGDVHTVQIMGYFDAGPPLVRIEAVIDATQKPAQIISVRDLTPLGIGYPRDLFTTSTSP